MADESQTIETLGPEGSKWLGEYSRVHMNVFGVAASARETWQGWVTC